MPGFRLHTIDLNFLDTPQIIAAYALVGPTSVALIETGPGSTLPNLVRGLRDLGVQPADVRDVLVTHIHLDHAGAAGWWADQGATVHVHAVGAPHLADPSRLIASATRIYGDQMDRLWGDIRPVPPERLRALRDGDVVEAAEAAITALDSPGHARHHHCFQVGDLVFTGDAAGVRLAAYGWPAVHAPPPDFDLEAWRVSLGRLAALEVKTIYPTHFGAVADPADHFRRFASLLDECAEFVRAWLAKGLSRDEIIARYATWYTDRARAAGLDDEALRRYAIVNDVPSCVDGISRYWNKREPALAASADRPQSAS
jgi:glyoxylase-like metal-dependent hydrolase (beta-lactamase superfamily II)